MCGILGFTGEKNTKRLNQLLSIIHHRGRDGQCLFFKQKVHMGMNRLAIVDLSDNLYPMTYKHFTLVFNGEIYNHKELKQKLEKHGNRFKTESDAEVILPLFHLYGSKAFEMLEGMFAISIYDAKKQVIILARDKSGEKPLYYSKTTTEFYFSSEMKVLASIPHIKGILNKRCLSEYFTDGFVRSPNTLMTSIQKLPPSSYLQYNVKSHSIAVGKYWEISPKRSTTPIARQNFRPEDVLDQLLSESVRLRLMADVPVGCFLSGGIDSSLISYYASKQQKNIHTYSVAFPGYEKHDESSFALYVSSQLHTRHTQVNCTGKSIVDIVSAIGDVIDEPIVDPAFLPTILLAKEARKKVKVVLTGEGADELFGGYSRYPHEILRESLHRMLISTEQSKRIWNMMFGASHSRILLPLSERYSPQNVWNSQDLHDLIGKHSHPAVLRDKNILETDVSCLSSLQLADYRGYMVEQLLNKVDKATMACNLEARAPYLDSKIIDYAFSLPDSQKVWMFQGKILLKKVAQKYFPKKFIWRKKHGFDIPLYDWLKRDLKPFVNESLSVAASYPEIFSTSQYKNIIQDHLDGSENHANKLWSMIVLTRWMDRNDIRI